MLSQRVELAVECHTIFPSFSYENASRCSPTRLLERLISAPVLLSIVEKRVNWSSLCLNSSKLALEYFQVVYLGLLSRDVKFLHA